MARADVTVRGAGVFGLSIAYACARRGARVRVIDPGGIATGASGGVLGALAPHAPGNWNALKAFQFESLVMAESFWAGVDAESGLSSGYARAGRIQPVADAAALALARSRSRAAEENWKDEAVWQVVPAKDAGPWAPLSPTGWLIRDTLSARICPRGACASLVGAIRALDGEIGGEKEDGAVVWATGVAGLDALSDHLGRAMGDGVGGRALLLDRAAPAGTPQIFADALHIVPHADGTTAVGSTSGHSSSGLAADAALDDILARSVAACPALAGASTLERWGGVRPRSRSRAPLLGSWPGRPGHFVANGGFKIGFGIAPKVAKTMADLVLDGRDDIPGEFRVDAGS